MRNVRNYKEIERREIMFNKYTRITAIAAVVLLFFTRVVSLRILVKGLFNLVPVAIVLSIFIFVKDDFYKRKKDILGDYNVDELEYGEGEKALALYDELVTEAINTLKVIGALIGLYIVVVVGYHLLQSTISLRNIIYLVVALFVLYVIGAIETEREKISKAKINKGEVKWKILLISPKSSKPSSANIPMFSSLER